MLNSLYAKISLALLVSASLPISAQLNLGKLKDKASNAISNSSATQNTSSTDVNTGGNGTKLFNGKDPFTGSGAIITTLAGSGSTAEFGFKDAKGRDALFDHPEGLTSDENGNIYVADKLTNRIRKVSADGEVTTFAGSGDRDTKNGVGAEASFDQPFYVWYDGSKNFYVVEEGNSIRKINKEGKVTTIFKGRQYGGYNDGEIGDANFDGIRSVVTNSKGELFVMDVNNNCIRKISGGVVSTFAGNKNAKLTYDSQVKDGPGAKATFWSLRSMIIDKNDNLYVIDAAQRVRKITPDAVVSTLPFEDLIKNTKSKFEIDADNSHGNREVGALFELAILANGNFLIVNERGGIYEVNAEVTTIDFVYTGQMCNSFVERDFRSVTEVKDGEDCKGCVGSDKANPLTVGKNGKIFISDGMFHCVREIKLKK